MENSSELISLRLPPNFINDFIEYWENVKRIVRPERKSVVHWRKWKDISQNMLKTLTIPLYDKWNQLGIFSWIQSYIKNFSSITLHFKGDAILLPKQLILYEAIKPDNILLSRLREDPSNESLERSLISLYEDLNIRLINSDLQILQKLAQHGFSKSLDRYPKVKELAYGIRRDARTVSSRLDYLILHQILSTIYLVDMARIGYQTILIFHKKERTEIPKHIQPYVVMFFPLTPHDKYTTIFQCPFNDTVIYNKILKFFNPTEKVIIKKQNCGWNFSGLTQNPNERWKLLPPILREGGNWNTKLILGETGVEFNLDPFYDPFPLTYRQGKLLDLIHKLSTMEEEFLAKQLKISRAYVTLDVRKLLRNRIIFRFPIFSNLGLGSWIYFCIRSLDPTHGGGVMSVLEHLKFFTYLNVYYNKSSRILIGQVNIPPFWTNRFIYSLTSLSSTYPNCLSSYYIGPDSYAPWSFDILGTFNWGDQTS
ncbi:MAG: hypothetical protein ACFFB5_03775 [Promethearchaeota archaeon]